MKESGVLAARSRAAGGIWNLIARSSTPSLRAGTIGGWLLEGYDEHTCRIDARQNHAVHYRRLGVGGSRGGGPPWRLQRTRRERRRRRVCREDVEHFAAWRTGAPRWPHGSGPRDPCERPLPEHT